MVEDIVHCTFRIGFYFDLYSHDERYQKDLMPVFEHLVKTWLEEKGHKVIGINFNKDPVQHLTTCCIQIEMAQKEYFYLQLAGKMEELNSEIESHITTSLQELFAKHYYA